MAELVQVTLEQSMTPPDDDWAKNVCKMGQGTACCCFLMVGPHGWSCAKRTPLAPMLMERAALKTMHAQSDNCEGRV